MHDELANGHLLGLGKGIPEDGVTFVGFVTIGKQVIGFLEIAAVDLVEIDKRLHVDRVLRLELQRVDLFRLNEHVVTLGVLITLDDLFVGNLLEALFGLDALQVFDRLATRLVDHAEGDRAFARSRGEELYRNEDKGQAKVARPDGNGSHGDTRERYRLPESGATRAGRK